MGSNATHGWRRSNNDKRIAVKRLLNDPEWAQWSNREIARQCRVGATVVNPLRKSICTPSADKEGAICHPMTDKNSSNCVSRTDTSVVKRQIKKPESRKVTRNGITYVQNTKSYTSNLTVCFGSRLCEK